MTDIKITPTSIVNARRIIEGPRDKYRGLEPVKYPWAVDILQQMIDNNWTWQEVSLIRDKEGYSALTEGEQRMFMRALAHLSNLDSIQLSNLANNIVRHITDPDIENGIHRQIYEEVVHVKSYSTIVQTIIEDPMSIYDMYRVNPVLKAKNDFITAQADAITNKGFTPENFVYAIVSNIVLEGVYFFSGFLAFHVLARMGKMLEADKMIKYIQRDEITHLHLFVAIYNSLKLERPELFTKEVEENCIKLFKSAAELEIAWGHHIIEGGVLGLTKDIITQYIQFLVDERARMIGLPVIYGVKNPVPWVDKHSELSQSKRDENFFETKVTNYSKRVLDFD